MHAQLLAKVHEYLESQGFEKTARKLASESGFNEKKKIKMASLEEIFNFYLENHVEVIVLLYFYYVNESQGYFLSKRRRMA